jgi:hypothetical protein
MAHDALRAARIWIAGIKIASSYSDSSIQNPNSRSASCAMKIQNRNLGEIKDGKYS